MGLLDAFTGGKSDSALDALKRAEAIFGAVRTPTLGELTLPELQKYVEAGIVTPEQAQAYLQESNAYNDLNIDQTGTAAQKEALNRLREISNAGERGTPMQQAQMENSLQQMRTADQGAYGAIEQAMQARGVPRALITAALENQARGQNAQQAHLDAVNSQAAAYQAALNALNSQGQVANALQGQQNAQANQVAAAANAMQQFNAQNQQQNSQFNAGQRQDANTMNTANKQQVANNNTGLANYRTEYNAKLPQQMFSNSMEKAKGQAGAAQNIGNMYQQQGQQNAGIIGGLINLGTSFIPKPAGAAPAAKAAHGGVMGPDGRMCMDDGGMVPGDAPFFGDTEMNDVVPANLSPGEAVIPRSTVAQNPEVVSNLLGDQESGPQIDSQDVATLLKALRSIRMGAV